MPKASSGGVLGADFQHEMGTNSPFSSLPNTSSRSILGADFQHFNGTNSLISNGTNSLFSNLPNTSSGDVLGADLQHFNGTNSPFSNLPNASSGDVLAAGFQPSLFAVTYTLVLLLGLAGIALSLSLSLRRVRPLSHSYILLLHLALLDALFLAALPLHIHSQLLGDTWSFGDAACGVTRALCCLHTSLSAAFLACLAGDAWLAALHPLASLRLRAPHYLLLATALWALALAATVPLGLPSSGLRSCFGGFLAQPAAPVAVLGVVFGAFVPVLVTVVGLPLAAWSVWGSRPSRARRRALGTISVVWAICALCFLPQQLSQLLQVLLEVRGVPREPPPGLIPQTQRVTEVLASLSCCLSPVLYRVHCSGRARRCPCRLRARPQRVFTICDHNFGDPSWGYRPGQGRGKANPRGWNRLLRSRFTQS